MTLNAWDEYGVLSSLDPATLSSHQRDLVSVCDLRQEVNSGGFDNYFRAWGGNTAPTALDALTVLIAPDWSELLLEAVSLFGQSYPSDPDERGDFIDTNNLHDLLDALDSRFYELDGAVDADALLDAHVNARPDAWS